MIRKVQAAPDCCAYCNLSLGKKYFFNPIYEPTLYSCRRLWCVWILRPVLRGVQQVLRTIHNKVPSDIMRGRP